jgi:signal peptidase I
VLGICIVDGESMYPTLSNKDIIFYEKISFIFSKPSVGDITLIDTNKYGVIVKRILAKENDIVEFKDENMLVNNKVKIKSIYDPKKVKLIVPYRCFYVIGDNVNSSIDSRYLGFINRKNIKAKFFFKIHLG